MLAMASAQVCVPLGHSSLYSVMHFRLQNIKLYMILENVQLLGTIKVPEVFFTADFNCPRTP